MAPPRKYKSPPHVLVRSFRLSRDRWKRKCQDAKDEVKRLNNRVRDLEKSRKAWADKASTIQARLDDLAAQPPPAPAELASTQKKT